MKVTYLQLPPSRVGQEIFLTDLMEGEVAISKLTCWYYKVKNGRYLKKERGWLDNIPCGSWINSAFNDSLYARDLAIKRVTVVENIP